MPAALSVEETGQNRRQGVRSLTLAAVVGAALVTAGFVGVGRWRRGSPAKVQAPSLNAHEGRIELEPSIAPYVGKFTRWSRGPRASHREVVNPVFMLRRSAEVEKRLEEKLYSVSTPGSQEYGDHMTYDEVMEFAPTVEGSKDAVLSWLSSHGVEDVKVVGSSIEAKMTVGVAEEMFGITMHHFIHLQHGVDMVRTSTPYTVPKEVAWALYTVGKLVQLPDLRTMKPIQHNVSASFAVKASEVEWPNDCKQGKFYVTPGVLRAAYGVPDSAAGADGEGTTMAISQFTQFYDNSDLNAITNLCSLKNPVAVEHTLGPNQAKWCGNLLTNELCTESLLDIEYIKSVAGAIKLTVISSAEYNLETWANSILARQGADANPKFEPIQSVSYGNDEAQQDSDEFMTAVNGKFKELGTIGVSVIFASGDMGVYGRTGVTDDGMFHPDFPAGSPYVTAVGGTNFVQKTVIGPEESWSASGGGFSDFFAMPEYQKEAVNAYLAKAKADTANYPDESHWSQGMRGYPDIAALGGVKNPYMVVMSGGFGTHVISGVGGTSASCPVVAGMFARINQQRSQLATPKGPMGFLNPFIYQTLKDHPEAFNDVQAGDNSWEGDEGFHAYGGWDAATGAGTPNFPKLLEFGLLAAKGEIPVLVQ